MAKKINKWVERLNSLSLKKDQKLEAQNKKAKEWYEEVYVKKHLPEIERVMQPLIKEIKVLQESYKEDFRFKYYEKAVDIIPLDKAYESKLQISATFKEEPFRFDVFKIFKEDYRFVRPRPELERYSNAELGWDFKDINNWEAVMDLVVEYIAEHTGLKDYE